MSVGWADVLRAGVALGVPLLPLCRGGFEGVAAGVTFNGSAADEGGAI